MKMANPYGVRWNMTWGFKWSVECNGGLDYEMYC